MKYPKAEHFSIVFHPSERCSAARFFRSSPCLGHGSHEAVLHAQLGQLLRSKLCTDGSAKKAIENPMKIHKNQHSAIENPVKIMVITCYNLWWMVMPWIFYAMVM